MTSGVLRFILSFAIIKTVKGGTKPMMKLYRFERGEVLARKLSRSEIRFHEKEFGKLLTITNWRD